MSLVKYQEGVFFVENLVVLISSDGLEYCMTLLIREVRGNKERIVIKLRAESPIGAFSESALISTIKTVVVSPVDGLVSLDNILKDFRGNNKFKEMYIESTLKPTDYVGNYNEKLAEVPIFNKTAKKDVVRVVSSIDLFNINITNDFEPTTRMLKFTLHDGKITTASLAYVLDVECVIEKIDLDNNKYYVLNTLYGEVAPHLLREKIELEIRYVLFTNFRHGRVVDERKLLTTVGDVLHGQGLIVEKAY